jgi:hypothetical protein
MTVGQKLDPINETRGTAICARVKVKKWAHVDSNHGPTGYASHYSFRCLFRVCGLDYPFTP